MKQHSNELVVCITRDLCSCVFNCLPDDKILALFKLWLLAFCPFSAIMFKRLLFQSH